MLLKKVFTYIEIIAKERYDAYVNRYSNQYHILKQLFIQWRILSSKKRIKQAIQSKKYKAQYLFKSIYLPKYFQSWKGYSKV